MLDAVSHALKIIHLCGYIHEHLTSLIQNLVKVERLSCWCKRTGQEIFLAEASQRHHTPAVHTSSCQIDSRMLIINETPHAV